MECHGTGETSTNHNSNATNDSNNSSGSAAGMRA